MNAGGASSRSQRPVLGAVGAGVNSTDSPDPLDRIAELAQLRDSGALGN